MSNTSQKRDAEKYIKRFSSLYSQILERLTIFCKLFLLCLRKYQMTEKYLNGAMTLWQILFKSQSSNKEEKEAFSLTLREQLRIMQDLSGVFCEIDTIAYDPIFWTCLREGLVEADNFSRKVSQQMLQSVMSLRAQDVKHQNPEKKKEFDGLWTTFFDVYETLESFGCHLVRVSLTRS